MANEPLLTVSQLTQAIKQMLEGSFPLLSLQGEVSNFKQHTSGHLYFSLKDAQAQISAVMYRADAATLRKMPKEGDQVVIKGSLTVYPPRGNYQLTVREMALAGLGELLLKLEELKVKLHKKGYFSKTRKKPIPSFPRVIGIVTSPTGAVIQDILNILSRRHANFHVILNPVRVQGEGAATEIARAIDDFNRFHLADVMIVGRGGGSIEDLWAFNEEIVAEAIYRSHIPIIAAVGHETDHCIAEYVADVRAPTPSAAAEMVAVEKAQLDQQLARLQNHLQQILLHQVAKSRHRLASITKHPVFASPYALLGPAIQKLDDLKAALDQAMGQKLQRWRLELNARQRQSLALKPTSQIALFRQKLIGLEKGVDATFIRLLQQAKQQLQHQSKQLNKQTLRLLPLHRERLERISAGLKAIDPKNLLKRGYAILFSEKERSVITSVQALKPQQHIRIVFADGEAAGTINSVHPSERINKPTL